MQMKAGFTLVELLIVIGLLGLLSVSISPLLRGNQEQALLSRQADIVRQTFYETVMKAKTGASEAGLVTTAGQTGIDYPPVRGVYLSTSTQSIRPVVLKTLSFTDAEAANISAILADSLETNNILYNDVGKVSTEALAKIEDLAVDTQGNTELLILFEPVSNRTQIITPQGKRTDTPKEITFSLASSASSIMRRNIAISPGISTIYEQ